MMKAIATLVTCAFIGTALCEIHAQNNPAMNAPGPGGFGRPGFGRGQNIPPGPPAPVPPEVAMQRPTTDEVARINAALQRFIQTSPERALLQKYQSLITV